MRFVERADINPMRCALVPTIGSAHEQGYVDTGHEMLPSGTDQHVYASVAGLRHIADTVPQVGLVRRTALDAAEDEIAALTAQVEELEAELSVAEQALDAVHVLKSKGYSAQRKPGRPTTKAA